MLNKIKLNCILIYKLFPKNMIVLNIFLILLLFVFAFGLNKIAVQQNHYAPNNFAYTSSTQEEITKISEQASENKNIKLYNSSSLWTEQKSGSMIINEEQTNLTINVQDLVYSQQASEQILLDNQQMLNSVEKVKEVQIAYLNIPVELAKEHINIPIPSNNIQTILTGTFPKTDQEVLIGETVANYYLQQYNLKSYDELLNQKIELSTPNCQQSFYCVNDTYTISGIYQTAQHDNVEEIKTEYIFMLPTEKILTDYFANNDASQGLFLVFEDQTSRDNFIQQYPYEWVTNTTFNTLNYELLYSIAFVVLLNLIIYFFTKKEQKYITNIINVYNISLINKFSIKGFIYIILNLVIMLIIMFKDFI